MEFDGDTSAPKVTLEHILGISSEAATTLVSQGHILLSEEKKHTFLRLHDMYPRQPRTAAARAAIGVKV